MELVHDGESIVLAVPDAVLGRTSASEIQVSHPLVSRQHCRFEATKEGVFVEDLGSSNGTYVNGERLTERRSMRPGDVVGIGQGGPQFTLLLATVDGRDVAGGLPAEDEATILAGDPRAAGLTAQVTVARAAVPEGEEEALTRESVAPAAADADTTGSIPVATPIGTGGESLLGATDVLPSPLSEPPTRVVEQPAPAAEDPNDATRPAAAPRPPPTQAADPTPESPPAPDPEPAPAPDEPAPDEPAPPADDATVAIPRSSLTLPTTHPPDAKPASRSGSAVLVGFVLGMLLVVALGVLTPLGGMLNGLAPWSSSTAGDAR